MTKTNYKIYSPFITFNEAGLTFLKVKQLYRLKPGSSGRTQQTGRFLFHCKCLLQFTSNFISTWTVENKRKITNTGLLVLRCTIQIELILLEESNREICLRNFCTFGFTYELTEEFIRGRLLGLTV